MTEEQTTPNNEKPEYDPVADPLSPIGKACSICGTEHEDEDWGSMGWIGIIPLSLCPMCESGVFNMVYQLTPIEGLRELMEERLEDMKDNPVYADPYEMDSDPN